MARISRKPIDPENTTLPVLITEAFEAIAADQQIAMRLIEAVAYLARTSGDGEPEAVKHHRGKVLDRLVEQLTEAMYDHYDRDIENGASALRYL